MIKKKEIQAIQFIRTIYRHVPELYAGNSGGKDSAVVDFLLQKSGIKYKSYYCNTTIDPPGTIKHIRNYYPHTEVKQPKESFFNLVKRKGLPTRLSRYCCAELKEYDSIGKNVFEGIRSCESIKRSNRDYIYCDTRKSQRGSKHIYPIYDWSDEDVYEFIYKYNIPLAPCYENMRRLGCIGCPLVSRKGVREYEFSLYPKYYEAIKKAIGIGMNNNPQWKLSKLTHGDSEIAMKWWLSSKTMNDFFNMEDKE